MFRLIVLLSLLSLNSLLLSHSVVADEVQVPDHKIEAVSGALKAIAGCGFGSSDLSNLNGVVDIEGSDSVFNYYMNMCGVVNNPTCNAGKPNVMVCQSVQPGHGSGLYALAYFNSNGALGGVWSYLNGAEASGLSVVYVNGDGNCYNEYTGQDEGRQLTMNFPCSTTQDAKLAFATSTTDDCHYTITFNTPLACPGSAGGDGGSSGLSGGWVFIIILIVLTFVYVVAGCVYKAKMQGSTGIERCPNIDFWRELPRLVKEGCEFTWRKLLGLCGGSSAPKSTGSYESL